MSQVKQRNWIYKSHEKEILYLQQKGDDLLQKINQHETKMNQLKEKKLQPNQEDLFTLNQMTKQLLHMLALIYTYRYLQSRNEPLTNHKYSWFHNIVNSYYLKTVKCFNKKLKLKLKQKVSI